MKLGERIAKLRTDRNMSQTELAERLDVSRQSVSKWETGASVPELDKLIKISDIFGITIDELVKGGEQQEEEEPAEEKPAEEKQVKAHESEGGLRRKAGIILLIGSAFLFAVLAAMSGFLSAAVLTVPFLLGAFLCLIPKRAVLWAGWAIYIAARLLMPYVTGAGAEALIVMIKGDIPFNGALAFMSLIQLGFYILLAASTALRFRDRPSARPAVTLGLSAAAYVIWRASYAALWDMILDAVGYGGFFLCVSNIMTLVNIALFTSVIVFAVQLLRSRTKTR